MYFKLYKEAQHVGNEFIMIYEEEEATVLQKS